MLIFSSNEVLVVFDVGVSGRSPDRNQIAGRSPPLSEYCAYWIVWAFGFCAMAESEPSKRANDHWQRTSQNHQNLIIEKPSALSQQIALRKVKIAIA